MPTEAKAKFAELIGFARSALGDARRQAGVADPAAVVRAATAASRAAGFIDAVTIADPQSARAMVDEFETLVEDVHASVRSEQID